MLISVLSGSAVEMIRNDYNITLSTVSIIISTCT